jgi:outer membrane protein assembly factor BamE (lipoprotein component of BamABCDE complex)
MSCTLKRKIGTKTCVTKLTAANIKSSPDEDIPARKKPRLQSWIPVGFNFEVCQIPDEASLPAIEPEAGPLNGSPDAGVAVASLGAGGTDTLAASPMQPNVGATWATLHRWTPEEDTKLTSAVKTTGKKKYGEEYRTDWGAVAALVPGRSKQQCKDRWKKSLSCRIETIKRTGAWTTAEDSTLKAGVEKHNGKDWAAISELVPGRTKEQCSKRWHHALHCNSDETARAGKWTIAEDSTLKDAVEKHNGKDWTAISELVSGRTKRQCMRRWHDALHYDVLHRTSDETTARAGKWTTEEDVKLKDAVEKHNGADWAAISKMVPGRTKRQCWNRWDNTLHHKSDETLKRTGAWTTSEDVNLKDAVEKHNGADWAAISKMVPGRTKQQCWNRWDNTLHHKSDETIKRTGAWTTSEDVKLKDAVEKHNGTDWTAISELVPGRTKQQCYKRWYNVLNSRSHETIKRTGKWAREEVSTLKDAIEKHHGKDCA